MNTISEKAEVKSTAVLGENVVVEDGVIIHDFVVIYPNVLIGRNTEIFEGCVIGKPPSKVKSTARATKSSLGNVVIGADSILCPHVVLYAEVKIGQRVILGDNCSIREQCKIGDDCIIARNVSVNYNTVIGDRVKIMDNTHITGDMVIEDDVFISVLVSTTNDNSMGAKGWHDGIKGPVIRRFATIGAGSNLLPNVEVGVNAIVGAGALVTKSIPDYKVAMGIPAKVVRDLRPEERRG